LRRAEPRETRYRKRLAADTTLILFTNGAFLRFLKESR
jgi:hypothetical protein